MRRRRSPAVRALSATVSRSSSSSRVSRPSAKWSRRLATTRSRSASEAQIGSAGGLLAVRPEGPAASSPSAASVRLVTDAAAPRILRFRVTARIKPLAFLINVALLSTLPAFVAMPQLLPLAVPVLVLLRIQLGAKAAMMEAIAQLAMECAEALGMPNAKGYRC